MKRAFRDLSAKSNAKEVTIGRTIENRCITAYEYGNIKDKPTILFVAGFHPVIPVMLALFHAYHSGYGIMHLLGPAHDVLLIRVSLPEYPVPQVLQ